MLDYGLWKEIKVLQFGWEIPKDHDVLGEKNNDTHRHTKKILIKHTCLLRVWADMSPSGCVWGEKVYFYVRTHQSQ